MTDLKNKFDALVAKMQTEESKEAARSLFRATPQELAEAYKRGITPRTSLTSPLRIDSIGLNIGDAAIGMTICPGSRVRVFMAVLGCVTLKPISK